MEDGVKYFKKLIKECTPVILKQYPDTIFYVKNLRSKKLNRILQLNQKVKGEVVLEKNMTSKYIFIKSKYWDKLIMFSMQESRKFNNRSHINEIIREVSDFRDYYITKGMMKYSKINNFF